MSKWAHYKGKIAVVTGAGSGMERLIMRLLSAGVARVRCTDIDGLSAVNPGDVVGSRGR